MIIETVFTDEDDESGLRLEKPIEDSVELIQIDKETYHTLFGAYRRHPDALGKILEILADKSVTSIRIIAERAVIEYSVSLENSGRTN